MDRLWTAPLPGRLVLLVVLPLLAVGCTQDHEAASASAPAADSGGTKDVPYLATPQSVVERMLVIADVSADDVVYDLGSGDGRFVITAAQQFGARGVGVEIDPNLVQQSRSNARLAGVTDLVEFRQGDLFETDLTEATVVTLYLEPELNLRLRPTLFQQLDPGDHVVSYRFDMGDWAPDHTEAMAGHTIYHWTIPRRRPDSLAQ